MQAVIQRTLIVPVLLACLGLFAPVNPAKADIEYEFGDSTLPAGWTFWDGYAIQHPDDSTNHASFRMTGSELAISIPGVQEHNMWWLKHAQVFRQFDGSGVYEIKVNTPLTGSQQFGLVFQKDPSTFLLFMLYATDQVRPYVERFSTVDGVLNKHTFGGQSLSMPVPDSGPYHLRVTVVDNLNPTLRTWKFEWSRDGTVWIEIISGVLEGAEAAQNAGAIQSVGLFAGNHPNTFSAFDARFDYFRYYSSLANGPLPGPANLVARAGANRVDLWWDPVDTAETYRVQRSTTPGGPYSSIDSTTGTSFNDTTATNGTRYYYVVTAIKDGVEGRVPPEVSAVPHSLGSMQTIPTDGLALALSAGELAYGLSTGAPVTQWPSALGPQVAALSALSRAPTFVAAGINGQAVVRFDGSDDYLTLSTGFQDFTAGMSLYIVARPSVLTSGSKLLLLGNGAGQQNIAFGRAGSTAGYQYATTDSNGSFSWFDTTSGLVAGEASVVSVLHAAGPANGLSYAEIAKNGVVLFGQNVTVPPTAARGINYIAKSYWSDGLFQGDIAEILLYNRALTTAEQEAVRAYLNQKYGLGTDEPPPLAAPASLGATAGDSNVSLNWAGVVGATGYRVQRRGGTSGAFVQIAETANLTHVDSGVVNGTTYDYVVTAYDSSRESAASNQVSATPQAVPPPVATLPTNGLVLALDAAVAAQQYAPGASVTVWPDSSVSGNDAVVGSGGAPTLVANSIGGQPAIRFDGVDDSLRLPAGFQNFTAGMSLYVVAKPTTLTRAFKLVLLGNGNGLQNIGLGRAGRTAGYQYFTSNSAGSFDRLNTTSGLIAGQASLVSVLQAGGTVGRRSYAELSKNGVALLGKNVWVPPVATRGTNYIGKSYGTDALFKGDIAEILLYNRILTAAEQAAVKGYVSGKYGLAIAGTTPPPLPPLAAPTNLVATAGNANVTLNWQAVTGASGYRLHRSTTAGSGYAQIAQVAAGPYTDTTVSNGVTYYYVATAYDATRVSAYSAQAQATPTAPPPPPPAILAAPTGLVATAGDGTVSLSWGAVGEATGYRLYRSSNAGGGYSLLAEGTATARTDTSVTNGSTYYYVVTAFDTTRESTYSTQVQATPTAAPPPPPNPVLPADGLLMSLDAGTLTPR